MAPKPSKPRRTTQRRSPKPRRKGQEYVYDVKTVYDQFMVRTRVPPSPHARSLTAAGNAPATGALQGKVFTRLPPVTGLEPLETTESGLRIYRDRRGGNERRQGERRKGPEDRRQSEQPVGHDHFDFNAEWQRRNAEHAKEWTAWVWEATNPAERRRRGGSRFSLQKGPAFKGWGTVAHAIEAAEPLHERNPAMKASYIGSYLDRKTNTTAYFYAVQKRGG